jgi:hypothetical protein
LFHCDGAGRPTDSPFDESNVAWCAVGYFETVIGLDQWLLGYTDRWLGGPKATTRIEKLFDAGKLDECAEALNKRALVIEESIRVVEEPVRSDA